MAVSEGGERPKKAAQKAMSAYIDLKTERGDGAYMIEEVKAELDYLHEGVKKVNKIREGKKVGKLYVSCADFTAGDDRYDIDYYFDEEDGRYRVVKEVFHKKNGIKVNKVIWEAPDKHGDR